MNQNRQITMGDVLRTANMLGAISLNPGEPIHWEKTNAIAGLLGFNFTKLEIEAATVPDISHSQPNKESKFQRTRKTEKYQAKSSAELPTKLPSAPTKIYDNDALITPIRSKKATVFTKRLNLVSTYKNFVDDANTPPITVPISSLLSPDWSRGILQSLLGVTSPIGEIDLDLAMERLAKGTAIERLPRRKISTLRAGVQILVDLSTLMDPYGQDQLALIQEIKDTLISETYISELLFSSCPFDGMWTVDAEEPSPYKPPSPGTPVLLLSNLGAGKRYFANKEFSIESWFNFIRLLKDASCPLIALVPYRTSSIPMVLRDNIPVVHWDRNTTAGAITRSAT